MLNKLILIMSCAFLLPSIIQANELSAKLNWLNQQQYGFVVDGVVEKVMLQVGDELKKGGILAQLEQAPFKYKLQKLQANIEELEPQVLDAKLELERANELLERASLSEIQLQKIETIYKSLVAKKSALKADLELAQWQQYKSVLRAQNDLRLVAQNIYQGSVVSAYNRAQLVILAASLNTMLASVEVSPEDAARLNKKMIFTVLIHEHQYVASWHSLAQRKHDTQKYIFQVKFQYNKPTQLFAGMAVKIKY